MAHAHAEQPHAAAITQGKPIIDVRARYEAVDDDHCAACAGRTAEAGTIRARLGYETGSWKHFTLAFDFDKTWSLGAEHYNSTRNGKTLYPIIADPDLIDLNRLQLTYATDFDIKIILGRQRLMLGNQRFIGNSGWRQHEQTYDAITLVNTSIKDLTLIYSYLDRVNRVFGPDDPIPATAQAGHFNSQSHLINAVFVGVPNLRLEGYGYLLDLGQPGPSSVVTQKLSTATFGLRGEAKFKLS